MKKIDAIYSMVFDNDEDVVTQEVDDQIFNL